MGHYRKVFQVNTRCYVKSMNFSCRMKLLNTKCRNSNWKIHEPRFRVSRFFKKIGTLRE